MPDVPAWFLGAATFAAGHATQWVFAAFSRRDERRYGELSRIASEQRSNLIQLQDALDRYREVADNMNTTITVLASGRKQLGQSMPTHSERMETFFPDTVLKPSPEWQARMEVEKLASRCIDREAVGHARDLIDAAKQISVQPVDNSYEGILEHGRHITVQMRAAEEAFRRRVETAHRAANPRKWLASLDQSGDD